MRTDVTFTSSGFRGSFMQEGFDYYRNRAYHPRAATEYTWTSIDRVASFDGFEFARPIAPRPLLAIIGTRAVTADNSMLAFTKANEPKAFHWIEGASHQDLYDKPQFVGPAVEKLSDYFHANLTAV